MSDLSKEREALRRSSFSTRARETAEREAESKLPIPNGLSTTARTVQMMKRDHYVKGFTTAVSRLPSEEEIAETICSEQRHTGDRECEYDHATARAVRELIEKKMLEG